MGVLSNLVAARHAGKHQPERHQTQQEHRGQPNCEIHVAPLNSVSDSIHPLRRREDSAQAGEDGKRPGPRVKAKGIPQGAIDRHACRNRVRRRTSRLLIRRGLPEPAVHCMLQVAADAVQYAMIERGAPGGRSLFSRETGMGVLFAVRRPAGCFARRPRVLKAVGSCCDASAIMTIFR